MHSFLETDCISCPGVQSYPGAGAEEGSGDTGETEGSGSPEMDPPITKFSPLLHINCVHKFDCVRCSSMM